jgi:hypothetical protein
MLWKTKKFKKNISGSRNSSFKKTLVVGTTDTIFIAGAMVLWEVSVVGIVEQDTMISIMLGGNCDLESL